MSKIRVIDIGSGVGWEVWISLDVDEPPDGLSFIIGVGATRADAIEHAQTDLRLALADLHIAAAEAQP